MRLALAALLAFTTTALAHDRAAWGRDGDMHHAYSEADKAWVKGLKSKRSGKMTCCDTSDGWPPEAIVEIEGKYRVKIDGEFHDVPPDAVVNEPNRIGYPMVWFSRTYPDPSQPKKMVPNIRCFIGGALL